jgi:hypothetical protein
MGSIFGGMAFFVGTSYSELPLEARSARSRSRIERLLVHKRDVAIVFVGLLARKRPNDELSSLRRNYVSLIVFAVTFCCG